MCVGLLKRFRRPASRVADPRADPDPPGLSGPGTSLGRSEAPAPRDRDPNNHLHNLPARTEGRRQSECANRVLENSCGSSSCSGKLPADPEHPHRPHSLLRASTEESARPKRGSNSAKAKGPDILPEHDLNLDPLSPMASTAVDNTNTGCLSPLLPIELTHPISLTLPTDHSTPANATTTITTTTTAPAIPVEGLYAGDVLRGGEGVGVGMRVDLLVSTPLPKVLARARSEDGWVSSSALPAMCDFSPAGSATARDSQGGPPLQVPRALSEGSGARDLREHTPGPSSSHQEGARAASMVPSGTKRRAKKENAGEKEFGGKTRSQLQKEMVMGLMEQKTVLALNLARLRRS
jgi:hypothetical protein